ncbi:MAG: endonuclease III domain-containing protein [Candidatus Omnitrophica bacterium]|nr:endonuclease III domain-containing protein [Candidatus Omnitrophota bacterium]
MVKGRLYGIFCKLLADVGPQHWWPADSGFEVMVGAILTQNTNWGNVEKAISNLKRHRLLSPKKLSRLPLRKLAALIKPSGYYRVKSQRLKNLVDFLFSQYQGDLALLNAQDTSVLRQQLLSVKGVGPETADSILLYACAKPVFVVDAYTKRILSRHSLIKPQASYEQIQQLCMRALPRRVRIFNEFHALLVAVGKRYCRPKDPLCQECPLGGCQRS